MFYIICFLWGENIMTLEKLKKYKHIHLIGIGGISMSAIAETILNFGIKVTGSDTVRK